MIARVLLLTLFALAAGPLAATWADVDVQNATTEWPVHADIDVEEETETQIDRTLVGSVVLVTPSASGTSTAASSLSASPPTRPPRA